MRGGRRRGAAPDVSGLSRQRSCVAEAVKGLCGTSHARGARSPYPALSRQLARLHEQQCRIEQATLETASLMEYCARVRSALRHFTLEEKRRALEALNITVIWHPEQPLAIRASPLIDIASSASQCTGQSVGTSYAGQGSGRA